MPSSVRPKASAGGNRAPPGTPMSERQQMALLMQMTSQTNEGSRSPGSASKIRDRNERGETPLHLAAIKGDVEQVCKLLAHRSDPNVVDFAGWTPLHEACNHGWYEVAFRLVQAGANVNAHGFDNNTPLHDAAINGHLRLVKMLVEHGADIHIQNLKGKAPLDVAVSPTVVNVMLNPNFPITEQSMPIRVLSRPRDEKKLTDPNKTKNSDDAMNTPKAPTSEDTHDLKSIKDSETTAVDKNADTHEPGDILGTINTANSQAEDSNKRSFLEVEENITEDTTNEDETKRKKPKTTPQRGAGQKGPSKQTAASSKGATSLKVADCPSPKSVIVNSSDVEVEDGKSDLKVPPLKIVIPQSSSEQETGSNRNGKNSSQRSHPALPYVVTSTSSDVDKDATTTNTNSPSEIPVVKNEEKKENVGSVDEQRTGHQRVLRSSHRSGPAPQGATDRSSNNSSPQLQRSHSPSPTASPSTTTTTTTTSTTPPAQTEITVIHTSTASITTTTITTPSTSTTTTSKISDTQVPVAVEAEPPVTTTNTTPSTSTNTSTVELHPRKRKMKQNKEAVAATPAELLETPAVAEVHPYEQPITNGYQLFLNIRKQIEKRRKSLFPVQPKPPQGFSDYLLNTCTYVLAGKAPTVPNIMLPPTLPLSMVDLFSDQEKERYRLRMQHVVEKEKMVLSVEQEILRVHGRAARALANHSLPFSACTILRDEEVYNLITPEQEEKDRNARSRYNGRLFLSWLQDLDDKWEKIKERMILRHHNEAESLHAVQLMNWEWKLKELNLCDAKTRPLIDETHVPMVDVSDELNLLIIESGP